MNINEQILQKLTRCIVSKSSKGLVKPLIKSIHTTEDRGQQKVQQSPQLG